MKGIELLFLIDDDDIYRRLTEKIVEKTDLVRRLECFSNGEEALHSLRARQDTPQELPDVIFLDLQMPLMDGWEFLQEFALLRPALGRNITIFIVSSSTNPVDYMRASEMEEVTGYVVKPITRPRFIELISSISMA